MNATSNFLNLLKRFTYFPVNVVGLGKGWMRLIGTAMEQGRGFRKKSYRTTSQLSGSKRRLKMYAEARKTKRARKVRKWNQRNQVRYHG